MSFLHKLPLGVIPVQAGIQASCDTAAQAAISVTPGQTAISAIPGQGGIQVFVGHSSASGNPGIA